MLSEQGELIRAHEREAAAVSASSPGSAGFPKPFDRRRHFHIGGLAVWRFRHPEENRRKPAGLAVLYRRFSGFEAILNIDKLSVRFLAGP